MEDSKPSKGNMSLPQRIPLSKKGSNPVVQFKLLAEKIRVMIVGAGIEQILATRISTSKEIAALYVKRFEHLGDQILDFDVPVSGTPASGLDKLADVSKQPLEQKLRREVGEIYAKRKALQEEKDKVGKSPSKVKKEVKKESVKKGSLSPSSPSASSTLTPSAPQGESQETQQVLAQKREARESKRGKRTQSETGASDAESENDSDNQTNTKLRGMRSMLAGSKSSRLPDLPADSGMAEMLGLSNQEVKGLSKLDGYYINCMTWGIEPANVYHLRVKLFNWMASCLMSETDEKVRGPYSHLIEKVATYDVAGLYLAIKEAFTRVSIISVSNTIMDFFALCARLINEKGVDIVVAHEKLTDKLGELNDMTKTLNAERKGLFAGLQFPPTLISAVIIQIASGQSAFQHFITQYLLNKDLQAVDIDAGTLIRLMLDYDEGQKMLNARRNYPAEEKGRAARANTQEGEKSKAKGQCPSGGCYSNWNGKPCRTNPCKFKHHKPDSETGSDSQGSSSSSANPAKGKEKG